MQQKKWQESNIEEILQHSAHKVENVSQQTNNQGIGMHTFTRRNFESSGADSTLDVTDKDFWKQLFEIQSKQDLNADMLLDDQERTNRLLKAIKSDEFTVLTNNEKRDIWWNKFSKHMKKMLGIKENGGLIPLLEKQFEMCTVVLHLKSVFTKKQRKECQEWFEQLQRRRRHKNTNYSLAEDELLAIPHHSSKHNKHKKQKHKKIQKTFTS